MKQYSILACAPYPELVNTYKQVASSIPEVILNVVVGDAQNIHLYLEMQNSSSYDAIIVPTGVASAAEHIVTSPVIEVELTHLDVLRTIRQVQQYNADIVIAVHEEYEHLVRELCDIMQYNYPIHSVKHTKEIRPLLRQLQSDGSALLIGDVPITQAASKSGISSVFLSIGSDSIRKAFRKAVDTCLHNDRYRERMHLFQLMADKSPHNLAILDASQTILYSNAALHVSDPASLLNMLRNYVDQTLERGSIHLTKKVANISFEIYGKRVDIQSSPYVLYYYDKVYKNFQPISVMRSENYDDQKTYSHYFFNSPEYCSAFRSKIESFADFMLPTLIYGQSGTGRQHIAREIYWHTNAHNAPFIFINCHNLNEKLWCDMISDVHSPFYGNGYTFYFHDIHILSRKMQDRLVDFISDTGLTKRCKIISSSTQDLSALVSSEQFSRELFRILSACIITIPSLKERLEELPALCTLILQHYNAHYGKQIIGFQPEVFSVLHKAAWNTNFDQLEQLIHQIVISKNDSYINVREIKDSIDPLLASAFFTTDHQINLSGTLGEIEARIISSVLAEEHMNQSAAAKRLGIGRTTLWRKLNT